MKLSKEQRMKREVSKVMSMLGKKSAEKRKAKGHGSDYYRELVQKRWDARKKKS